MFLKTILISAGLVFGSVNLVFSGAVGGLISLEGIPEHKRTETGLYLSSDRAFEVLQDNPSALFIDVRTVEEIENMGHPKLLDAIVPLRVPTGAWDQTLDEPVLAENPEFLSQIKRLIAAEGLTQYDMLIITCGSGVRSAAAARLLEQNGFTYVWHLPDGYEGDDKPGLNTQNAWKNLGLPWSDKVEATVF